MSEFEAHFRSWVTILLSDVLRVMDMPDGRVKECSGYIAGMFRENATEWEKGGNPALVALAQRARAAAGMLESRPSREDVEAMLKEFRIDQ